MSAGVPVVVSPTVAVADAVARHAAGTVVLPDPGLLAAALTQYAVDREFLKRAGAAGPSAAAEFSVELHGERLERVYLRVSGLESLELS
jgi:glycosyltransferase involved in cell wall biosynthesis